MNWLASTRVRHCPACGLMSSRCDSGGRRRGYLGLASEAVTCVKGRLSQCVAALNPEVFSAVQETIHSCDRRGREILFLSEQPPPQRANAASGFFDMLNRFDQHASGAARRIVDAVAFVWVRDPDHQIDHAAKRAEFSGFLVGRVRDFLDEILIRLAKNVGAGS